MILFQGAFTVEISLRQGVYYRRLSNRRISPLPRLSRAYASKKPAVSSPLTLVSRRLLPPLLSSAGFAYRAEFGIPSLLSLALRIISNSQLHTLFWPLFSGNLYPSAPEAAALFLPSSLYSWFVFSELSNSQPALPRECPFTLIPERASLLCAHGNRSFASLCNRTHRYKYNLNKKLALWDVYDRGRRSCTSWRIQAVLPNTHRVTHAASKPAQTRGGLRTSHSSSSIGSCSWPVWFGGG